MYDVVSPLGRQTEEERVAATVGLDLVVSKEVRLPANWKLMLDAWTGT